MNDQRNEKQGQARPDANQGPMTSEPGAHPVGVGLGREKYAYRIGWEGRGRHEELNWEKASPGVRDAWDRLGADTAI